MSWNLAKMYPSNVPASIKLNNNNNKRIILKKNHTQFKEYHKQTKIYKTFYSNITAREEFLTSVQASDHFYLDIIPVFQNGRKAAMNNVQVAFYCLT